MKQIENYIPKDIIKEAHQFIKLITEDIEIYKKIKSLNLINPSVNAEKFVAYWDLERYENYAHALITLFEYKEKIDKCYKKVDELNAFNFIVFKLEKYYEVLHYYKMIED